MRLTPWLSLAPLLLAIACQRPEVEAFKQRPTPVSVKVSISERVPGSEEFQKEYASALRARLATRLVVIPEGVTPPPGAAELQVDIRDVYPAPGSPDPAAVGVATGVTVGILSSAGGHRGGGWVDGLFWGLWAGTHAANARDRTEDRLGYRPQVVKAIVRLVQAGNPEPLWVESIEPYEVVSAMDPLPTGYRDDDGRIREEEAKGFARVVVRRLVERFMWVRVTEQRFYEDPAAKKAEAPPAPEPKPEPAPQTPAPEPKKD